MWQQGQLLLSLICSGMKYNMFKYTPEDYEKAVKFLKSINKEQKIKKELSTDGYSIIALANSFLEKQNDGST